MNDELKYCKFCDKEKPKNEFCKSGFAIKNICRECQNKKQKEKLNASKNWNELKNWLKEQILHFQFAGDFGEWNTNIEDLEMVLDKMQELENRKV